MKVYCLAGEQAHYGSFEIDCTSISRAGVLKVFHSIPGLVITQSRAWYNLRATFCEFELGGSVFQVRGPTDARPRFWIGPAAGKFSPHLEIVRTAFLHHRIARWLPLLRIVATVSLCAGSMLLTISPLLAPTKASILFGAGVGGVFVLIGTALFLRLAVLMRDGDATGGPMTSAESSP